MQYANYINQIEWSGRLDSNQRPSVPKTDALPGCATPRRDGVFYTYFHKSQVLVFGFYISKKFMMHYVTGLNT